MPVKIHFFGEPYVEIDGRRLEFPLKKAEAALFCVAYEGHLSRERLKTLFWGDKPEEQASGNLRNAIYVLRRLLPDNFFPDRRRLFLENHSTDLEGIDALSDPDIPIDPIFMEEPMRGVDMKDRLELDEWLVHARNGIRGRVTDALRNRITSCYERNMPAELILSLEALLALDPYDEDSMLELMEALGQNGAAAKAVSLFNGFRAKLESDIGTEPSERACARFKKLLGSGGGAGKAAKERPPGEYFCCRVPELERISGLLSRHGKYIDIIFVHGEAGVGKTALVSRALELCASEYRGVYAARPNSAGEKYPYSSWTGIVSEMGRKLKEMGISLDSAAETVLSGVFYDFPGTRLRGGVGTDAGRNPVIAALMLSKALKALSEETRPVLVFEDVHWFDQHSLSLLQAFISCLDIPAAVFLTSRPEAAESMSGMLYGIKTAMRRNFTSIELMPFDQGDTMRFCRTFLPEEIIARRGEAYFREMSDGMPLLLVEMLRILSENPDADCSDGLMGVMRSRMQDLPATERELLSVLSVFGSGASYRDVASVMDMEESDLFPHAEALLRKKFIRETGDQDEPLLDFLHSNVRDCAYSSIPAFRRKYIHGRIAGTLEARYSPSLWNPELGESLRRHCTLAGMRSRMLKHYLEELGLYVALNHDLFPLIEDRVLRTCGMPLGNREDTEYKIAMAEGLLGGIGEESPSADPAGNRRLEASYLEIKGAYLISWGDYREGRVFIDRADEIAGEHGFDDILIRCCEHVGHHFLQTDDARRLLDAGRRLLSLSFKVKDDPHKGMALRFIGMAMLIRGDFTRAKGVFERSVEIFEKLGMLGRRYTLNILAAKGYIGEMLQWTWNLDRAMELFEGCAKACEEAGLYRGRGHFHAHAANTALDMGDWDGVYRHVDAGIASAEHVGGRHMGSMIYSLKAICDVQRGTFGDAAESLRRGEILSAIGKKTWRAVQLLACAWAAGARESGEAGNALDGVVHSPEFYALEAERLCREIGAENRADVIRSRFLQGGR
ncbi:MAG: AAA family ATPase [Synergistaceae bacterium]|nr:AAA family ATPase [Synergistaceae bacterium]